MLNSKLNFQIFNDKMILSTSKDDRKIFLWDEKSGSVAYTFEDDNIKTYIPKDKLIVLGKDLYSEYIISLQENKSIISIWKTNASNWTYKFSLTEERISSLSVSLNNKLLFVSTVGGNLLVYVLSSGCLLISLKMSSGAIYDVLPVYTCGSVLVLLCEDSAKLYYLSTLLEKISSNEDSSYTKIQTPIEEIQNYEDGFNKIVFTPSVNNIMVFYKENKNKFSLIKFPSLAKLKTLHFDDSVGIGKIIITYVDNVLGVMISVSTRMYFLSFDKINKQEAKSIFISVQSSTNTSGSLNVLPMFTGETNITNFVSSGKNIITGHEDGKVLIWAKNNKNIYQQTNLYNIHKGAVTNLLMINRPISQYGLNFNNKIEEVSLNRLQTQTKEHNYNCQIGRPSKCKDSIESLIEESLERYNAKILFEEETPEQTKTKNEFGVANEVQFLKGKVNELYNMLN